MPLIPIDLPPGIYAQRTPYASKPRWVGGNLVRFPDGVPEQVGGWTVVAPGGVDLGGTVRELRAWRRNTVSDAFMVLGSEMGIGLYDGAILQDITPYGFVPGRKHSLEANGYGGGIYSFGLYGTPRPSGTGLLEADQWTTDNWGEMILACWTGNGVIYEYDHGETDRMIPVAGAPRAYTIFVSDERHVFAVGADNNRFRVRWSDQEVRGVWDPSALNKAGGFTLRSSGALVCGRPVRRRILLWSTEELFELFPTSRELVYGYERIGTRCGIVGPKAVATVGGEAVFWFARDGFWVFDQGARKLDCEVEDYVFDDINLQQRVKFHAATNSLFDEVWFFYCSAASIEIDRAVSFNYRRNVWSTHQLPRTAWVDRDVFDLPHAMGADGALYRHEDGESAAGAIMPSFVESFPMELGNGDRIQHIKSLWVDGSTGSGSMRATFTTRLGPRGAATTKGPFLVTGTTERVMLSMAGRQMSVRFQGAPPGSRWKLGTMRFETQPGGLR